MAKQEGFYLYAGGEFVKIEDPLKGHNGLAVKIIKDKGWEEQYKCSKYKDPVDFLIFVKEAIKVGNQLGEEIVTISCNTKGREVDEVLVKYEKLGWKIDIVTPF